MPSARRLMNQSLQIQTFMFFGFVVSLLLSALVANRNSTVHSASLKFAGPNLVASDFRFAPTTIPDEGTALFQFTVSNQGTSPAPTTTSAIVIIAAGGPGQCDP